VPVYKNAAVNIKQEAQKEIKMPVASRFKPVENYMGPGERLAMLAPAA
jgi:hypothetical protein